MVAIEVLRRTPGERGSVPFDAEAWNRAFVRVVNGEQPSHWRLVASNGALLLKTDPELPGVSSEVGWDILSLTLANGQWLASWNAAHSATIPIVRVSPSDIVELAQADRRISVLGSITNNVPLLGRNGAGTGNLALLNLTAADILEIGASAGQLISVLAPLTNNVPIQGRDAANAANIRMLSLNASNVLELGQGGQRVSILAALTNAVPLTGRTADNSGIVAMLALNALNQVDLGASGIRTNLLGTVAAPAVDPPTVTGQVTAGSVAAGWYTGLVSGGVLTHGPRYNATATRSFAGDFVVAWTRAFATANYHAQVTVEGTAPMFARIHSRGASGLEVAFNSSAGVLVDPVQFHVTAWGTLS